MSWRSCHGRVSLDIISMRDLKKKEILRFLDLASKLEGYRGNDLDGKILATLFFEPSTRTRLSFQSAVQRLGGSVIGFDDVRNTSQAKGESLSDTIRVVERYADAIVMRHPMEGAARLASKVAGVPVINAGDGANQHPTQTLLDLYTIHQSKGRLDVDVALVGDLKYARVMKSLALALSMFGAKLRLISPAELRMDDSLKEEINALGGSYEETDKIDLSGVDVVYLCRIQKERFPDLESYHKVSRSYRLLPSHFDDAKHDVILLHPLPRVEEMDLGMDLLPCAKYFDQVERGVTMRMAILKEVMG